MAGALIQKIYDVSNDIIIPDISPFFLPVLEKRPLISMFSFGTPVAGSKSKFTWAEEVRTDSMGVLGVTYTAASGLLQLVSTTMVEAGDQVKIIGHRDASFRHIIFSVTTVTNATDLAVTVVYGTDTSFTLASPAQKVRVNKSKPDLATAPTGKATEPTLSYSYLQLMQIGLELGEKLIREAANGMYQGIDDIIVRGAEQKLNQLAWDVYKAAMYSFGVQEASATAPAKTRGLLEMINTSSDDNRINAGATALSEAHINSLVEKLILRGLDPATRKVLVMSTNQARRLSQLRKAKVTYTTDERTFGGSVVGYQTELDNVGLLEIVVDENMEPDTVLLVTPEYAELVPAIGRPLARSIDNTLRDRQYGRSWIFDTELGLKVMYATRFHGVIYNLI